MTAKTTSLSSLTTVTWSMASTCRPAAHDRSFPSSTDDFLVALMTDQQMSECPANCLALLCTLVTSGQVAASMTWWLRSLALTCTVGATPCAENTTIAPGNLLGHFSDETGTV